MKRTVDVLVASVLLVVTLPVIAATAILTALILRDWPFFTHARIGRNGEEFRMVKIRTLPRSAPEYADKYEIGAYQIPRFSALLRRLHLDELPQLWLVITGKMSMVGPRPEMRFLHQRLDEGFARRRTSVRPGCTGLWQVSDRSGELIVDAPELDEFYVRHCSLKLDAWIVARTLLLISPFRGRAVQISDVPSWAISPQVARQQDIVATADA